MNRRIVALVCVVTAAACRNRAPAEPPNQTPFTVARVEYAVSDQIPPEASAAWMRGNVTDSTISLPKGPLAAPVWLRGRVETSTDTSAWTAVGPMRTSSVRAVVSDSSGTATVKFEEDVTSAKGLIEARCCVRIVVGGPPRITVGSPRLPSVDMPKIPPITIPSFPTRIIVRELPGITISTSGVPSVTVTGPNIVVQGRLDKIIPPAVMVFTGNEPRYDVGVECRDIGSDAYFFVINREAHPVDVYIFVDGGVIPKHVVAAKSTAMVATITGTACEAAQSRFQVRIVGPRG